VRGGVWLKAIFHRKLTQLQYSNSFGLRRRASVQAP
jgi:hypothetical protein